MPKMLKYFFIFLLFILLVLIRAYENQLFYDPYLTFFKNDYLYIDSPRREVLKLVFFTSLRFWLNTVISLGIIYLCFTDWSIIKFSILLYAVSFLALIAVFLYFVINPEQDDYYLFFNFRRFLIQPVLLILLLPAFYYYNLNK
ncbi:exosortase F system-associated membrane protein [Aestuariibaculum sediminum]|uniref:Exosortase F system-associated protein n=1 Tax=Aestuariibaculum sediminum TaxID=2770637 RepID=A0A8J6Q7V1_9FLAO|nr:exosortase F system-associated protein [Aestuariibaculum sediminum]MBD0832848.1 exosortase F system-associated protein [Aestuariibaculum sediminum]